MGWLTGAFHYGNESETKGNKKSNWFQNFQTKEKFEPQHVHVHFSRSLQFYSGHITKGDNTHSSSPLHFLSRLRVRG